MKKCSMFLKNNLHYLFSPRVESSIHRNKHIWNWKWKEKEREDRKWYIHFEPWASLRIWFIKLWRSDHLCQLPCNAIHLQTHIVKSCYIDSLTSFSSIWHMKYSRVTDHKVRELNKRVDPMTRIIVN